MYMQDTYTSAPKAQSCNVNPDEIPMEVNGSFVCVGTAETGLKHV